MKLHRWTIKEIEVLKLMYPCYTAKEIGAYFGVSIGSVTAMAFRLGIKGVKRMGRPRGSCAQVVNIGYTQTNVDN